MEQRWSDPVLASFIVATALIVMLPILARSDVRYPWPWLDVIATASAIFFVFKSGFVRWDIHHTAIAFGAILLLMIVHAVLYLRAKEAPRQTLLVLMFTMMLLIVNSFDRQSGERLTHSVSDVISLVTDGWRAHTLALKHDHDQFQKRSEARAAEFSLRGSVDVYPDLLNVVAHRPGYAPRPVPQSYAALSTHLARLNSEHLSGEAA